MTTSPYNRPSAFCYEDSLIIAEKDREIENLRNENNRLKRELNAINQNLQIRLNMAKSQMDYSAEKAREAYGG